MSQLFRIWFDEVSLITLGYSQIAGCIVSMYVLSPSLTMGMLVVVSTVIVGGTMIGTLLRGISRVAQQHATQVTTLRYTFNCSYLSFVRIKMTHKILGRVVQFYLWWHRPLALDNTRWIIKVLDSFLIQKWIASYFITHICPALC